MSSNSRQSRSCCILATGAGCHALQQADIFSPCMCLACRPVQLAGGMGASCGMPLTSALLAQLAAGVEQANVLAGAYR